MPPVKEPDEAPPRLAKRAKVQEAEPPSPPRPCSDTRKWKKFPACAEDLPAEAVRVQLRDNHRAYGTVPVTVKKMPSVFVLEDREFSTQPKFMTHEDFRGLRKTVRVDDVSYGVHGPDNKLVCWLHTAKPDMSLTDPQQELRPKELGSIKYHSKAKTARETD